MKTESDYLLMLCGVVANMKKAHPELNKFAIFGNVINNGVMELLAVTHDINTDIDRIDYIELSNKSDEEIKRLMQLAITNWHDMPGGWVKSISL